MQVFKEVVGDLWRFIKYEVTGYPLVVTPASSNTAESLVLPPQTSTTTSTVQPIIQKPLHLEQTVYIAYPQTPCYLRPAFVLDTLIGTYSYGMAVTVVGEREGWVHIRGHDLEGWTERIHLAVDESEVFPSFQAGQVYDAHHPETLKLRTVIDDEFGAGVLQRPLLNCEYVWYKLLQAKKSFPWPPVRPRTPGRWSEILRTVESVHVSRVPLTGAVMEYTDAAGVAQLVYVQAVTPEETVEIMGMTGVNDGMFEQRSFTNEEWRALDPKFLIKI